MCYVERLHFALVLLLGMMAATEVSADEPAVQPPAARPTAEQHRAAIDRAINFVINDAAKWRDEKKCATCHHGTMTVWVLAEAARQEDKEKLADISNWTRERLKTIDQPRDTRPGWKMISTPALYLSVMDWAVPAQQATSKEELQQITGHLLRHQEEDGSWAWSSAPPQNRAPPHFESDEVATLLACLALGAHPPAEAAQAMEAQQSRERAFAWLAKQERQDTTQAAGLRLLLKVQAGEPRSAIDAALKEFAKRQNADGGWSQISDIPSDAYATGQALYFLGVAGAKQQQPAIERGVSYLLTTQQEDGSWPMTPRAHAGAKPSANTWPIRYFGSTWATLGLLRSKPE